MAEALVIAAECILTKVVSIAANEIALALGYKKKLETLHEIVDLICAKLRDAERQKETEAVTVWMKHLKHAVGEADDVLDEVHYEMLRSEVNKRDRIARKVPSLPSLKKFSFRREIGHQIENISKKLLQINKQASLLGLQNAHFASVPDCINRETDPYLDEFEVVGREDDELHIIQLLTQPREDEKLTIVRIVGMGGIGKTTLAKSIYNDPKIEQHFDVRAWLCVSVKVDINTLLAKIYESFSGEECKSRTRVNLITNLRKQLGSKKYLLVLDDVWDEERAHWDDFRSCMLKVNSPNGCGILLTTRNLEIGIKAMTDDFRALQGLSHDHCWSIFKERAFGQSPLPELEEIGHDIVKKCRGLPLLVNVIGGMLRNYNDKEKWLSIKDNKVWDLEEVGDRVQNSLKLSFDNLPNSSVKRCFAYCSIFQKNKVMKKEELIQLWMALGLVQADESRNKEMEDVGNDIFQILVNNSLLQDVKRDEYGCITSCTIHDLVHDLSLSLSKHESLCLVSPTGDDTVCIPQVKHLVVDQYNLRINMSFKKLISMVSKKDMPARTLHTLFFKGEVESTISFQQLKCLRILKFNGCKIKNIDDSIGELVHLRYLDLSNTQINSLPKSLCKLYHLQTLKLCGCYRLKEFPKDMRNLISLRDFEFQESIPIHNVGQLTSLRTLPSFGVSTEKGHQIEELGHLKHLSGKLRIYNLEEVRSKEDALMADLSGKKNLDKIEFIWSKDKGANRNDKDVLEGLQAPKNVKSLIIENFYGDNFPAWAIKMNINLEGKQTPLNKLVDIKLSGCCCLNLPILENLPLLRNLVLRNMDNLTCLSSSLGQDANVTGPIKPLSPSLKLLKLRNMKRLEKWIDGATNNSTMISPVLEKLYISECPKMVLLDENYSHPLISLELRLCDNLVTFNSIYGLTSLKSLVIDRCHNLLGVPDLHNQSRSLRRLEITDCYGLTSLPSGFDYLGLLRLEIGPFSSTLDSFPSLQGIEKSMNRLHTLQLRGWPHWDSIPEEVKHLTSLTFLIMFGFGLRELPVWLANMSSIRLMMFDECWGLDKETVKGGAPREAEDVILNGEIV
ncbi:hypothetical protein LXL04_015143 [Taraxacum kok-saghyz]